METSYHRFDVLGLIRIMSLAGENWSMISLTRGDWSEIYYALELKSRALKRGKYGVQDYMGQDVDWVRHLDNIIEKIGPDGRLAARGGVERCK
jgi:hypothetical protein